MNYLRNNQQQQQHISDLKPYFKDDLERLMKSTLYTAQKSGADQNQEYWQGFQSALKAIAIAVGIAIPIIFLMVK